MTSRPCGVSDVELERFADGGAVELETHIGTCADCQRVLEEMWSDGSDRDLSPAVMRTLEFDEFVKDAVGLVTGIGTLMVQALMAYIAAYDEEDEQ